MLFLLDLTFYVFVFLFIISLFAILFYHMVTDKNRRVAICVFMLFFLICMFAKLQGCSVDLIYSDELNSNFIFFFKFLLYPV